MNLLHKVGEGVLGIALGFMVAIIVSTVLAGGI